MYPHPTPYTLHPTPHTLPPTPYPPHPTPHTPPHPMPDRIIRMSRSTLGFYLGSYFGS
ncbi:MAG: hypothetical protein F6J93_12350 [Oscillatoria sp. SIO1A7]|nr:hypothetical protein [Oscillatoria sp. SIO1A7]